MTNPSIAKRKTERDLRIIELATNNPNITAAQIGELVQYGRDLVFRVLKAHGLDRSQARNYHKAVPRG